MPLQVYISSINPQRQPSYAVKQPGSGWTTRKRPLSDRAVAAHLRGDYAVAAAASWYPQFAAIDLDDAPWNKVLRIREDLGLDERNSMLCTSESKDSYHLLFRPVYDGRPPTAKLLGTMLSGYARDRGVEVYPHRSRPFRLPFGPGQQPLLEHAGLETLEQRIYWWNKLDDVDLAEAVPQAQLELPLGPTAVELPEKGFAFEAGQRLFSEGLEGPASRHRSQFAVLYHLWRLNLQPHDAVETCFSWIKTRHNGYSRDVLRYPEAVRAEIVRQAAWIWSRYDLAHHYPDATHNGHYGYLTRADLAEAVRVAGGNLPRLRFLAALIRYLNPRRHRGAVAVHSDLLVEWSSKTNYLRYLDELAAAGVLERGPSYVPGSRAKEIRLRGWRVNGLQEVLLQDGRSLGLEEALRSAVPREELRQWLKDTGKKKSAVSMAERALYGPRQKFKN